MMAASGNTTQLYGSTSEQKTQCSQLFREWAPGASKPCLRWHDPSTWHCPRVTYPKWVQVKQLLCPLNESSSRSSTKPHSSIKPPLYCACTTKGVWLHVQASVVTSASNRSAPSGLSTLVFLPITLAILVASAEATSNDAADVWRCHSRKGLSSSTRNCLSAMPLSISRTQSVRSRRSRSDVTSVRSQ